MQPYPEKNTFYTTSGLVFDQTTRHHSQAKQTHKMNPPSDHTEPLNEEELLGDET